MKKILIVSVNWLGDAIMLSPACRAIKQVYPNAYLGVMAPNRVRGVFADNPYVDEVIVFDEKRTHKSFFALISFVFALRSKKYDTVFLIHRSFTRALICALAGIKIRIGFTRKKTDWLLTKKINPPRTPIHRQDYYLYLFEQTGISIKDRQEPFFIAVSALTDAKCLIDDLRLAHSRVVGINAAANWEQKRWPKQNFARLADRMIKELNCACFFIGAPCDNTIVGEVIGLMKQKPYNFCGKTNLRELAALIRYCDLFVSVDSGPAHLAAGIGIRTLVLFGPTSFELTGPAGKTVSVIKKDIDCPIPCYNLKCFDNVCMKQISVDEVFEKAKQLLT